MGRSYLRREDPFLVWLAGHLTLVHGVPPAVMEGKHVTLLEGFHDGLHGTIGATYEDAAGEAAYEEHKRWLSEMLTDVAVRGMEGQ